MSRIDQIRDWLKTCNIDNPSHQKALERACLMVYANQTADEMMNESTRHLNGAGFNGHDARFGTFLAKSILDIQQGKSKYTCLSKKMYEGLRKMMVKYSRQIAEATGGD